MMLFIDRQDSMISEIIPANIPQITDPRIILQTFNAPSPPVVPGTIPQPKIHLDVTLPTIRNPEANKVIIDNEIIKEDRGKGFRSELKSTIEDAFLRALEEDWHTPRLQNTQKLKPKVLRVNILETPSDRLLNSIAEGEKSQMVNSLLKRIHDDYDVFNDQVDSKLKFIDFLLKKWTQRKLDFIIQP